MRINISVKEMAVFLWEKGVFADKLWGPDFENQMIETTLNFVKLIG